MKTTAKKNEEKKESLHCDGSRRRRHSANKNKASWYALHRSIRFSRRFSLELVK